MVLVIVEFEKDDVELYPASFCEAQNNPTNF